MEDNTVEQSEPDFKLCGSCGAVLGKDAKFCKRCGAPVVADGGEPTEQNIVAQHSDPFDEPLGAQPIEPFDEPPQPAKFCMRCGAKLEAGYKFCRDCGTPVGESGTNAAAQTAGAGGASVVSDKRTKNKRVAGGVLYLVGACISVLLGFVFFCTPFMSISVSALGASTSCSQSGITLIGVMFGARSDLVDAGVNSSLLTWASWLYFAFLFALIYHCVCAALNVSRYIKGKRPYALVQSSVLLPVLGFGILIVGIIARAQAGDWVDNMIEQTAGSEYASLFDTSSYLGFVAVFVVTLIGAICAVVGYAISNPTFLPYDKRQKKTGAVLAIFITDIVCGAIIGLSSIAAFTTTFAYNSDKEITVSAGDSGKAKLTCDEYYNGNYVGATVFKLNVGEGDYVFRIETDDVGQYALAGSIALVEYDAIQYLTASEIFDVINDSYIDVNTLEQTGDGYAYLDFSIGYDDEYAIVVGFTATGDLSVKYDYSLKAD